MLVSILLIPVIIVLVDNARHGLTFILEYASLLPGIESNDTLVANLCLAICGFFLFKLSILFCTILFNLFAIFGFFNYDLFENFLGIGRSTLNL